MTKPRESLLNLFDPLARAGAGSSTAQGEFTDLSSSDKENSSPSLTNTDAKDTNLTMTKFFSRTYSHDQYMTKPLPQGALIDFDVSMANSAEGDSDDENVFDARLGLDNVRKLANGSAKKPLATPRRKVLADIPAAESISPFGLLDATPIGFKKISQRNTPSPTPLFFPPVVSSTQECALDDLPSPPTAIAAVVTPVIPVLNTPAPSPPDYIHSSTLHGSGYQRDRRESLDLHTSFNMHLHDTSFDLLNDRISLLESDSLIGSEQSAEDIAVSVEPTTHDNSVRDGVSSAEEESDRGGLADVESDSDADATGAVLHRLAAIALDSVAEPETEITSNPLNPLALITPKIHPIASAAPRAPHPNKLLARSCPGEPVGAPEPEDTHKVIGGAPRPQEAHAPAAPIAALRIVKKAKPTSHARSLSRSVASSSIEHVATRTASPPSHLSRIPASAEVLPQLKPLGSRSQKAAPSAKQTCAAPAPRPSTASLLKYGPQGRKREAVVGRAPSVSRHSTSSVARDHMSQLQLDAATADATDPALPTIRTSSGIRPPSRFNSTSSAGLSRMQNVAAPPKIPPLPKSDDLIVSAQQPRRDVAQVLRGSVRQKTSTKRV